MTAPALTPITLTVTVLRNERDMPSIMVANDRRPKGEWIPRALIIDMTREAEDGSAQLTIAKALAQARGLV